MLKIHLNFTQIPLIFFGNQQLLVVFLPKKESSESDFGVCCFRPVLCPLSFGKSSQISFGDHMQSQWGHHTRCHDANNWLIHSPMDGFWGFPFFFSIVNRTVMNNFFELKLAKVNFCYLQLQNTNWSMWEYRKFSIIMHHCL